MRLATGSGLGLLPDLGNWLHLPITVQLSQLMISEEMEVEKELQETLLNEIRPIITMLHWTVDLMPAGHQNTLIQHWMCVSFCAFKKKS